MLCFSCKLRFKCVSCKLSSPFFKPLYTISLNNANSALAPEIHLSDKNICQIRTKGQYWEV